MFNITTAPGKGDFDHAVLLDGEPTGCNLVLGDLHGVSHSLFYPSGNYVGLGTPHFADAVDILGKHWQKLQEQCIEEDGLDDVADLFDEPDIIYEVKVSHMFDSREDAQAFINGHEDKEYLNIEEVWLN